MRFHRVILLSALGLLAVACSGPGAPPGGGTEPWVGSTTTAGNVTTVINESGSVWGGAAALVEEASIGVETGEDAYMFGEVDAVWATEDEIYVLDSQVPALRVYDMAGRHLRDLGAEGDGPGEFRQPRSMVVDDDGRIWVRDARNARITILSPEGEELDTLPLDGGFFTSDPMVLTLDGTVYNFERAIEDDPDAERQLGMVPRSLDADREGEAILPPDFDFEPWSIELSSETMRVRNRVPFAPSTVWSLSPSGALVAGVSTDYSFEIRYPDGRVTRVVKPGAAVPVDPAEAAWHKSRAIAGMRRMAPEWTWNGREVPPTKPAYQSLIPDRSGRIWVVRPGPGYHVDEECAEDPASTEGPEAPCWRQSVTWDVFDEEGRFLGGADVPAAVRDAPALFIRDSTFLAPVVDDFGTAMVKRYRLVLPGEAPD